MQIRNHSAVELRGDMLKSMVSYLLYVEDCLVLPESYLFEVCSLELG